MFLACIERFSLNLFTQFCLFDDTCKLLASQLDVCLEQFLLDSQLLLVQVGQKVEHTFVGREIVVAESGKVVDICEGSSELT